MESKHRLKDRLHRLFRPPAFLLSARCSDCRSTTGSPEVKENKERIVREIGKAGEGVEEGRTGPPASPSSLSKTDHHHYHYFKEEEKVENKKSTTKEKKKKKKKTRCELSSSSFNQSVDDFGYFSSEEREVKLQEEDTETFLSSRSFSSDSSNFYKKARRKKKEAAKAKYSSSRPPPRRRRAKKSKYSEIVNDGFQPLVSISGRLKEEGEAGFAMRKKSNDPYGDFQSSILEMIMERQLFEARELQWLLQSYLSLNSPENHPVIIKAFADIYHVLPSFLSPRLGTTVAASRRREHCYFVQAGSGLDLSPFLGGFEGLDHV